MDQDTRLFNEWMSASQRAMALYEVVMVAHAAEARQSEHSTLYWRLQELYNAAITTERKARETWSAASELLSVVAEVR